MGRCVNGSSSFNQRIVGTGSPSAGHLSITTLPADFHSSCPNSMSFAQVGGLAAVKIMHQQRSFQHYHTNEINCVLLSTIHACCNQFSSQGQLKVNSRSRSPGQTCPLCDLQNQWRYFTTKN